MGSMKKYSSYRIILTLVMIGFASYFIKFMFNLFLAHHLSKELYGDFMLGLRSLSVASMILLFGTGATAQRFLAYYLKLKQEKIIYDYVSWNLKLILRITLLFLLIFIGLIGVIVILHLYQVKSLDSYHLALYLLLLAPLNALSILFANYLMSNNNTYVSGFFSRAGTYLSILLIFISVYYVFNIRIDETNLWIILLISVVLLVGAECFALWLLVPSAFAKLLGYRNNTEKNEQPVWILTSRHLIASQLAFLVLSLLDLYIIEIISNNKSKVGHFAVIFIIADIMWVVSSTLYKFITPKVSYYLQENKLDKLQSAINSGLTVAFVVLVALELIIIIWGQQILAFFGPGYNVQINYLALLILSAAYFIGAFCKPAILLLINSGNEKIILYVSIIEFICLLSLGMVLTYTNGLIGLSLANLITIIISTIILVVSAKLKVGCKPLAII